MGYSKQATDMVWVYLGTGEIYPPFPLSQLIDPKINPKTGLAQAGTLLNIQGASVSVEYVTTMCQKNRIKNVWVYAGTGQIYCEEINLAQLINCKRNKIIGEIKYGELPQKSAEPIQLERITRQTFHRRLHSNVWVHYGTGFVYPHSVDAKTLINTLSNTKTKQIEKGDLQLSDGSVITLEWITKRLQKDRATGTWVYRGTITTYAGEVNIADLSLLNNHPTRHWRLERENQAPVELELLTMDTKRTRIKTDNKRKRSESAHEDQEEVAPAKIARPEPLELAELPPPSPTFSPRFFAHSIPLTPSASPLLELMESPDY